MTSKKLINGLETIMITFNKYYQQLLNEYSLNEPQGHSGGAHHDSIEDLFTQRAWGIGERGGGFSADDFEDLKPYIANWDTLLEIIDEENTIGPSERWHEVEFKYGPKGIR